MKIAVVHNLPTGGARRSLGAHVRGLIERGHHLEVFAPSTADESFHPIAAPGVAMRVFHEPALDGSEPGLFGARGPLALVRDVRVLRALHRVYREVAGAVDRGNFDVVLVGHDQFTHAPLALRWMRTPTAYYCQEPLRLVYEAPVGLRNVPTRALPFSVQTSAQKQLLGAIDRRSVAAARVLLANSLFSCESIMRAYGRTARAVYLGIDARLFQPHGLPREPFVLSVGALHPTKGFDFIIKSLACVNAERRPPLIIVADRGGGALPAALQALAAGAGVSLEIRTRISDDELVNLMNRATAVVYAPYLEPFGLVPLEAMACGAAVVAVAEGGVRESVTHGETGLLTPREENAFARSLECVLSNPDVAARLGGAGRRAVLARWTWACSCEQLERELTAVAACPRA